MIDMRIPRISSCPNGLTNHPQVEWPSLGRRVDANSHTARAGRLVGDDSAGRGVESAGEGSMTAGDRVRRVRTVALRAVKRLGAVLMITGGGLKGGRSADE